MADITVQLVSVDRMIWTGEASIVTAQTTEGEIGILPGHEPILGQLKDNGVVTINPVDGERIVAAVQGGFLSVVGNKVTVLADWATLASEVDSSEAELNANQDDDELSKWRGQAELAAVRRAGR
ncbi:F0F1 ATP synthase subunit epsilon [Corynebacterium sanguinis]|uniref:ATP synthase epsilon chain n=1 Tax=Corynebacterium sanguinis TaxID=2594913 RepID=A0A6C1TWV8_9CORY|nr:MULTISPECIES: F0F1 ATP synthase subunit epsilon [Corynebacterium]MBA4504813.1 F0F1 ATP synthase subunit epsilon [Corynebacterium sanguinis]MCT1412192.1 F0F1 ATP synthase subunit epsilon [Corynebacterium sanguinis]MCT1414221.1 F0F1 ATP synthase subunit epsilon [Corynebacterium sanguinis]MCT1425679.1 F0F1 ATP synthase subunit epsilon [Corynebacterium sanguinis]MCT1445453.1 F0F1 ATP synthase subunit epsilon [Corynebacterium sanguinis]